MSHTITGQYRCINTPQVVVPLLCSSLLKHNVSRKFTRILSDYETKNCKRVNTNYFLLLHVSVSLHLIRVTAFGIVVISIPTVFYSVE